MRFRSICCEMLISHVSIYRLLIFVWVKSNYAPCFFLCKAHFQDLVHSQFFQFSVLLSCNTKTTFILLVVAIAPNCWPPPTSQGAVQSRAMGTHLGWFPSEKWTCTGWMRRPGGSVSYLREPALATGSCPKPHQRQSNGFPAFRTIRAA